MSISNIIYRSQSQLWHVFSARAGPNHHAVGIQYHIQGYIIIFNITVIDINRQRIS